MKKTILLFLVFIATIDLSKAQWQTIPSYTTSYLTDICFVNDSTGFILCYEGNVLKTTNGGNNWTICSTLPPLTNNGYRALSHVGNDTIYAAGPGIYRSCDCGATWQLFIPDPGYIISYLHYFSSLKGIYIKYAFQNCYDGTFGASVDRDYIGCVFNADSSLQISSVGGCYLSPPIVINDSLCYMYKYTQDIYSYHCSLSGSHQCALIKSNDQGQNWTTAFSYPNNSRVYPSFINKDTGFFFNGYSLSKTVNGGSNISLVGTFPVTYSITEAMFINDSVGYVISSSKIYKISATALSKTLEYSGSYALNKFYKTNNGNIFAIGTSGIIIKRNPNIITNINSYQDQFFAITPNPATSKIIITNSTASSDNTTITIFNLCGEEMMFDTFNGNEHAEMDVSALSKGLYVVKIHSEVGMVCKKLVIE